ncbi:probable RNA-binding protein CG14230 [Diachasma alloeum]|uniref:probable RNA-binding protein CG14230 n=1 Tax=Diachasma alloeum TaxID=454923 RepID=UPI0007384769|nr:probable RNA-binding protein CG14230 [Diachasma alloeum]
MIRGRDSDAVRRASLKKQKEAFREKELLIRNALNSVDGSVNKKIIFDDNIGEQEDNYEQKNTNRSKKRTLFDDDDDKEGDSRVDEFDFSENKKAKVVNLGNDPRFAMDKRFLEEENENQEEYQNEEAEDEMTSEKNKQLEILQNVLGKPLAKKNNTQVAVKRKNQMIRYDPTQDDHQKHELQKEEPQPKKKKRKAKEAVVEEEKPIPVSTETFYSVSENLTETLKAPEEFSLLQRFGTAPPEKTHDVNEDKVATERKSKFGENFDARNPFRYDSSDDEGENTEKNVQGARISDEKVSSSVEETFFLNPAVFKEAEEFFKNPAPSNESFKKLRRELKEIVRTKIRRNIRKTQLWKRKKINQVKPRHK